MNKLTSKTFKEVCRICLLLKSDMRPIFEAQVSEMLMFCTSVKVEENDPLPQHICVQCLQQINRSYTFRQLCEKSDAALWKFLQNPQSADNTKLALEETATKENTIASVSVAECSKENNTEQLKKAKTDQLILDISEHLNVDKLARNLDLDEGKHILEANDENMPVKDVDVSFLCCDICGEGFSSETKIQHHIRSAHCDAEQNRCSERKQHQAKLEGKASKTKRINYRRYECGICKKRFCNNSWLEIHMRKHTGERPLTCETCGKTFYMPSSLNKHILTHFEKKHFCGICNKGFTQEFQLTVHTRTHTGERPYVCNVCGKGAITSEALNVHLRTHTGEKPYKCNLCDAAFASRSQLTIHVRRHTGQKPYVCSHCQKSFLRKGDLDTHVRYHTGERPYACTFCPKKFHAHSALRVHMMSHTGERPHECSVCSKSFVSSHSLKTHLRTHTGEKPYACDICGQSFSQSGTLTTHKKNHADS